MYDLSFTFNGPIDIDQIAWRQLIALEEIEKLKLPALQRKLTTPKRKPETIRWRGQYLRAIAGRIHGLITNGVLTPSPTMQAYMEKMTNTLPNEPIKIEEIEHASQVVKETIVHLKAVLSGRPRKTIFH